MIESDTIKLLRECDAGIQMGVNAIDMVLPRVESEDFKKSLLVCRREHEGLDVRLRKALHRFGDAGKDPNPLVQKMSEWKTALKMTTEDTDAAAASLIVDGCNMGIKSLSRYLNQYPAASENVKGICQDLIASEEKLSVSARGYL